MFFLQTHGLRALNCITLRMGAEDGKAVSVQWLNVKKEPEAIDYLPLSIIVVLSRIMTSNEDLDGGSRNN